MALSDEEVEKWNKDFHEHMEAAGAKQILPGLWDVSASVDPINIEDLLPEIKARKKAKNG